MAEIFKFFNSAPGDERWHYASDFADYFGSVLSSGLLSTSEADIGLQVSVNEGTLTTNVSVGKALIKGYSYENTTNLTLTHTLPETENSRIDRVVLRFDLRNQNRYIRAFVKEGIPSLEPVAPELQRDQYVYELSLARILVVANTASLNQENLTDERLFEDVCGIVNSLITVPTSVFQKDYDKWKVSRFSDFKVWLDTLKNVLDENTAGNLYNLITTNTQNISDSIKQRKDIVLFVSGWVFDEELEMYKYQLNDESITIDSIVDVNIHFSDLFKARDISSACESFDGYVVIYSANAIHEDITIDYRVTKDVI